MVTNPKRVPTLVEGTTLRINSLPEQVGGCLYRLGQSHLAEINEDEISGHVAADLTTLKRFIKEAVDSRMTEVSSAIKEDHATWQSGMNIRIRHLEDSLGEAAAVSELQEQVAELSLITAIIRDQIALTPTLLQFDP
ncbi:uncharacterized protein B0T23DRAFT_453119 [Neurospora hispaniola]|uniref:Uncharacterized protein n=1 Tax=Neurospora hispaniola TaxID=588809 RepID=A0AAJ0IAZ2_9PEZI|nr:hypothetical protein B0T23DRAFT_453119 [Neurospora hispaniola]